jgi:hypothetical protein
MGLVEVFGVVFAAGRGRGEDWKELSRARERDVPRVRAGLDVVLLLCLVSIIRPCTVQSSVSYLYHRT